MELYLTPENLALIKEAFTYGGIGVVVGTACVLPLVFYWYLCWLCICLITRGTACMASPYYRPISTSVTGVKTLSTCNFWSVSPDFKINVNSLWSSRLPFCCEYPANLELASMISYRTQHPWHNITFPGCVCLLTLRYNRLGKHIAAWQSPLVSEMTFSAPSHCIHVVQCAPGLY